MLDFDCLMLERKKKENCFERIEKKVEWEMEI
jgi:hypothetical protein